MYEGAAGTSACKGSAWAADGHAMGGLCARDAALTTEPAAEGAVCGGCLLGSTTVRTGSSTDAATACGAPPTTAASGCRACLPRSLLRLLPRVLLLLGRLTGGVPAASMSLASVIALDGTRWRAPTLLACAAWDARCRAMCCASRGPPSDAMDGLREGMLGWGAMGGPAELTEGGGTYQAQIGRAYV